MNDKAAGRLAVALAGLLVLVVGLIFMTRGSGSAATPTASPGASGTASSPSLAAPSPTADASPSPAPSASASAAASPSASGAAVPASFTVVGLKLDATDDPAGQARIITFTSDAPGTITVSLRSSTPQGTTHMCLSQGSKEVGCQDWAKGTFTRTTSQANVKWTVTVIGSGIETPVVDVSATFPAAAPSVLIEHARFDGTAFPDSNGIQVTFLVRIAGNGRLQADWGGHPFTYQVSLSNESTGSIDVTPGTVPSTGLDDTAFPVQPGTNSLTLQNTEAGFGTTDLTVSVGWP